MTELNRLELPLALGEATSGPATDQSSKFESFWVELSELDKNHKINVAENLADEQRQMESYEAHWENFRREQAEQQAISCRKNRGIS